MTTAEALFAIGVVVQMIGNLIWITTADRRLRQLENSERRTLYDANDHDPNG